MPAALRRWLTGFACAALLAAGPATAVDACNDESVRADCLAARSFAAFDVLPADEKSGVIGTLLAVYLTQHVEAPPALLAQARRIARAGKPEERLQVLLPLAEIAFRAKDATSGRKAQRAAEAILGRLAQRRERPEAYLQIADSCLGLVEMLGGAPVLVPQWAAAYRRYCQPDFLGRMKAGADEGFKTIVRAHLQLVGHFLVQDREAFRQALPGVVTTLRSVGLMLDSSELTPPERETAMIIATALQMSAGTLACLLELAEECEVVMSGLEIPEAVVQPDLWSSWAAIAAVRGEGLAAAGRQQGGRGALNWLLARAGEAEYRSHRAAFLASAAWLADRLQVMPRPRRATLST